MAMKRKHKRLALVLGAVAVVGAATALALTALSDKVTFFATPSELVAMKAETSALPPAVAAERAERHYRVGGLVAYDSIQRTDDVDVIFGVTDEVETITVIYRGDLPDLFREGQGVVVEGRMEDSGVFRADRVLARHDENYMPAEVAESLKKSGHWKHTEGQDGAYGDGAYGKSEYGSPKADDDDKPKTDSGS